MDNKVFVFERSLKWIMKNTIDSKGIAVSSKSQVIYPEVTGYYIPTLLQWGERELALSYAEHLCSIQKSDGSWYDPEDRAPYVFDSAQILKGLISIRQLMPEADEHIIRGCEWLLSNMQPDGRLITPDKDAWGDNENFCSELIHLYCLTPLRDAGKIFNKSEYLEAKNKILEFYKREYQEKIKNFSLLSHFYAYVMEGLFDLGEVDLCRKSMSNLEKYRNRKGGIPGLKNVSWVCSTGLFQLALVWYKLGDLERGNRIFEYALSLQNESGGWYGSYPTPSILSRFYRGRNTPYYFPDAEISWANKYFLDALAYKEQLEFERQAPIFSDRIDENDGRYMLIRKLIEVSSTRGGIMHIADIGCGKGRYLKNLKKAFPQHKYFIMDLSEQVMKDILEVEDKKVGSLTCIPYESNCFDFVYVCEALEHAISLRAAVHELYRIIKPGGKLVVIDKPEEKLGQLEIEEWEQWIDDGVMNQLAQECGGSIEIVQSISYENGKDDGLFRAWIITKPR